MPGPFILIEDFYSLSESQTFGMVVSVKKLLANLCVRYLRVTLSLSGRLDRRRIHHPARLAYVIDGVERDNQTSIDHVFRIANGLIASGIGKGDRIAVLSRNSVECAEVMTAILCSGASMVPVPSTATAEAQKNMLLDSAVKGLFVSDQYRDAALAHFMDVPTLRPDLRFALESACDQFRDHVAWAKTFETVSPGVHMALDEEYDILYSSGTTGIPKGIIHSHLARNLLIAGTEKMEFEGGVVLTSTPLYSNTTITTWWPSVWVGATQVIMRKFNAERANELIRDYAITHAMLVPVQYQRMWASPNHSPDNWKSVKWLFSTSAPLSAVMKEKILADTSAQLLEFYGLTEGGVATTLIARKAAELGKLGSVGQVQPGGELKILGENGELLGPNESGEIVGRTGIMSDGYLNREEATKAMHWFDEQGRLFYRSGDVGYLDEDGWLFLSDRIKDMILSGGQNIYATDLEQALNALADVVESAVVAKPSEEWGETPWAFVVRRADSERVEEDIRLDANKQLSPIQAIAGVTFMDELPRSDIGKILKRQLRDTF